MVAVAATVAKDTSPSARAWVWLERIVCAGSRRLGLGGAYSAHGPHRTGGPRRNAPARRAAPTGRPCVLPRARARRRRPLVPRPTRRRAARLRRRPHPG